MPNLDFEGVYQAAMTGWDCPIFTVFPATTENLWRFCPWIMLFRSRDLKPRKYRSLLYRRQRK